MSMEYINGADGTNVTAGAQKLEFIQTQKRQQLNPFMKLYATPIFSEATSDGGSKTTFKMILGGKKATRRTAAPTNNQYEYGNNIKLLDKDLIVSEPLESQGGKLIPTSKSDVMQLDGMNFTPIAGAKTVNGLVLGEIDVDKTELYKGTKAVTYDPADDLGLYNALYGGVSNYFDISEANGWDAEATKYFDGGIYSYTRDELQIFIHPSDVSEIAIALNKAGSTTSDLSYQDLTKGAVRLINGVELVETRYADKGKPVIAILGVIGKPAGNVQYTLVKTTEDAKGNLGTYGKSYYNSTILQDELVTIVSPTAAGQEPTKFKKALVKSEAKVEGAVQTATDNANVANAEAQAKISKEIVKLEGILAKDTANVEVKAKIDEAKVKLAKLQDLAA